MELMVDATTRDVAEADLQLELLNLTMGLMDKVTNKSVRARTWQEVNVEATTGVDLDVATTEVTVGAIDS